MQTNVALKRIEVFLNEDEVDDQVSSMKRSQRAGPSDEPIVGGFGLNKASFRWNAIDRFQDKISNSGRKGGKGKGKNDEPSRTSEAATTTDGDSDTPSQAADHAFELRDISIVFPERQLTVITGPTASGKTALLVSL